MFSGVSILPHPLFPGGPVLSAHSGEILPAFAVLLSMTPYNRIRTMPGRLPLESIHPEAAQALRRMQREPQARLLSTVVGEPPCAVALEEGDEGNALLHYIGLEGSLTLAAGWLGAGRKRYLWVPLRPTLGWNPLLTDVESSLSLLGKEQIGKLAHDLHLALTQLDQRYVIEEFLAPDPIPYEERQATLRRYTQLLGSHGWEVVIDPSQSRRSLHRTPLAEDTEIWPQADREELARLEALVAIVLKGSRSSSVVLYQNK